MKRRTSQRRFFAPEVIQSSAMDCGPASLKCLLEGHGIPVSYGRLREACQTDVDGTSIDTMEEVAVQLGLDAEQIMVPSDHLLLPAANALPALIVVQLPNGNTHFVILWRSVGNWVQVMDPGSGRRWLRRQQFLNELYLHRMPVPASAWREWAESDEFLTPLQSRLANLGLSQKQRAELVEDALRDLEWHSIAALDAATRITTSIVQAGRLRGRASKILAHFYDQARHSSPNEDAPIPPAYWSVTPLPVDPDIDVGDAEEPGEIDEPELLLKGAVLVRVLGKQLGAAPDAQTMNDGEDGAPEGDGEERADAEDDTDAPNLLSPELTAALIEPPARPGLELLRMLRADGLLTPALLMIALLLAAAGVLVEALLLRGLLDIGHKVTLADERILLIGAVIGLVTLNLLLQWITTSTLLRYGRWLETRLRTAFLAKIPRLDDRYFQSRLISDMAERTHSVYRQSLFPLLGGKLIETALSLGFTTVGILWLAPESAPLALLSAIFALGIPLVAQPTLAERDLRTRSHLGALSRFYLDGLLGLVPIQVHGAERAVRREHEGLLVDWAYASHRFYGSVVTVEALQAVAGIGLTIWLLLDHLNRTGDVNSALLLVYWTLSLPVLGQQISLLARQYPSQRSIALRLLEPLNAPENPMTESPRADRQPHAQSVDEVSSVAPIPSVSPSQPHGVKIEMQNVGVRAGGHLLLQQISLTIQPGEHVAVVGASGAGKSTLVGLLLGWHRPAYGLLRVDGHRLENHSLQRLHEATAWVDPSVQIWNRSLLQNLHYGTPFRSKSLAHVIDGAELRSVLEKLPDGLQSTLGEGGSLVSGGEGQRVRLGRAMLRKGVRLAILDEPFRGLDRKQRQILLERTRTLWQQATLLCITHDIGTTQAFDRVIVIDGGQIAEMGTPTELIAQPDSLYNMLLEAERDVHEHLWADTMWRHLHLEKGRLR